MNSYALLAAITLINFLYIAFLVCWRSFERSLRMLKTDLDKLSNLLRSLDDCLADHGSHLDVIDGDIIAVRATADANQMTVLNLLRDHTAQLADLQGDVIRATSLANQAKGFADGAADCLKGRVDQLESRLDCLTPAYSVPVAWVGAITTADVLAPATNLSSETDKERWSREADEWIKANKREPYRYRATNEYGWDLMDSFANDGLPNQVFDALTIGGQDHDEYPTDSAALDDLHQALVSLRRDGLPLPTLDQ